MLFFFCWFHNSSSIDRSCIAANSCPDISKLSSEKKCRLQTLFPHLKLQRRDSYGHHTGSPGLLIGIEQNFGLTWVLSPLTSLVDWKKKTVQNEKTNDYNNST